jgi:hypothetical protein
MEGGEPGAAIVLAGPPRRLSAIVPQAAAQRIVSVTLQLGGERPEVYSAYLRPISRVASELRLRLPRDTPPGRYRAQAPLGGAQQDLIVMVEPASHVQLHPASNVFNAGAGASVEFALEVTNAGNVAVDVPGLVSFDLDDAADRNRALGRSFRAGLEPGERRVDRLFEELRAAHGGEARVSLWGGKEPLSPGESRQLKCVLQIPGTVQVGRTYEGSWELADASHDVVVAIKNGTRSKETPGA